MLQNPIDDMSIFVQIMARCRQAPNHYLKQCWPWSKLPYGVSRPECVSTTDSRYWHTFVFTNASSQIHEKPSVALMVLAPKYSIYPCNCSNTRPIILDKIIIAVYLPALDEKLMVYMFLDVVHKVSSCTAEVHSFTVLCKFGVVITYFNWT